MFKIKITRWDKKILLLITIAICFDVMIQTSPYIPTQIRVLILSLIFCMTMIIALIRRCILGFKMKAIWLFFYLFIFFSRLIHASIFDTINFQWGSIIICLLILQVNYEETIVASKFLIFYSVFQCFGIIAQIMLPQLWATIFDALNGNRAVSEYIVNAITTSDYGYINGFSYNPGFTAIYLVNGIVASILLWSDLKGKLKYLLMIFLLCCLVLTGKRGEVFAIILAGAFCFIYFSKNNKKLICRLCILISVILLGYILGYILYTSGDSLGNSIKRILEYVYSGDLGNAIFSSGREELWKQTVKIFFENPIWGVGWWKLTDLIGNQPHNTYLQILCELGIVGFIIFIIAIFISLWNFTQYYKMYKNKGINKDFLIGTVFYQIYFIIISLFENTLCNIEFFFMYFFVLVIGYGYMNNKGGENDDLYFCTK